MRFGFAQYFGVPTVLENMQEPAQPNATAEHFNFAWRNFDNHQALIRAADTKAGFLLTLLLFLTASTFPLGKDAIAKLRWVKGGGAITSGAYLASYVLLAVGFVWALILISQVLNPRRARHYAAPKAGSEILYFEHVVLHGDNAKYYCSVVQAAPALLLRNVTDQVFELAHICKLKMGGLRSARIPFGCLLLAWVINTVLGLWIARWT